MIADLRSFLHEHRRLFVLTGAGASTASGIPDYRDTDGRWKRRQPVQFNEFLRDQRIRHRYWARSMIGWPRFSAARPGAAHQALVALEQAGRIHHVVTQNVDGLHQQAGSRRVIDLHGRLDRVECLSCGNLIPREALQRALEERNPGVVGLDAASAPDGDADLERVDLSDFEVPDCEDCGGRLKPAVVFFGETVPKTRVAEAFARLEQSDAVLVVGSSLMVWSGFRFVRAAAERGKPIAAVNLGRTRADALFCLKVERDCGEALRQASADPQRPRW